MAERLYTLEEAAAILKADVKSKLLEGSECPTCTQFAKLYPVKVPAVAVKDLIRLYNLVNGEAWEYQHVNEFANLASRSFAKLAFWELIEAEANEDTAKRTSGMWCLTSLGKQFVEQSVKIPNRAYIYDSQRRAYSKDLVDIKTALGNKFNYEELMNSQ